MSEVTVTNNGPGDVFDLDVNPAAGEDQHMYRQDDSFPVPKLPQGKSIVALQRMPLSLGDSAKPYFNIVISGKTADGVAIEQTEFVSGA